MADARDALIVAQNAATAASNIVAAEIAAGVHGTQEGELDIERYELIRVAIAAGSLEFATAHAAGQLATAFPGATEVPQTQAPVPQAPVYQAPVPTAAPVGVPVPGTPPVPQVPQAPPVPQAAAPAAVACKKCGGPTSDRTLDNARKRAGGFKLGPDYECPAGCKGGNTWPSDYDRMKLSPSEPRR